jgi:hypothetical protein
MTDPSSSPAPYSTFAKSQQSHAKYLGSRSASRSALEKRPRLPMISLVPLYQGSTTRQKSVLSRNIIPLTEEFSSRTIHMVASAMSQLSHGIPGEQRYRVDHNSPLRALLENLTPILTSLRSEPVDYEFLTDQLTQAVKPHISQLIDLASDKRGLLDSSLIGSSASLHL